MQTWFEDIRREKIVKNRPYSTTINVISDPASIVDVVREEVNYLEWDFVEHIDKISQLRNADL